MMTVLKWIYFSVALVVLLLAFAIASGCSMLERVDSQELRAQLFVDQSTARFIAASGDPAQRAAEVERAAESAMNALDADPEIHYRDLRDRVIAKVEAADLSPADRRLLLALASHYGSEIDFMGATGMLTDEHRAQLRKVLTWAMASAQTY